MITMAGIIAMVGRAAIAIYLMWSAICHLDGGNEMKIPIIPISLLVLVIAAPIPGYCYTNAAPQSSNQAGLSPKAIGELVAGGTSVVTGTAVGVGAYWMLRDYRADRIETIIFGGNRYAVMPNSGRFPVPLENIIRDAGNVAGCAIPVQGLDPVENRYRDDAYVIFNKNEIGAGYSCAGRAAYVAEGDRIEVGHYVTPAHAMGVAISMCILITASTFIAIYLISQIFT
jgi:hypothetical protein